MVQTRLVGTAQVQSGSVVLYDNTSGATRIVGVLASFDPGTAAGAISNSRQATTATTGGPHVESGERWALVTRVDTGQQLSLQRWNVSSDGGMSPGVLAGAFEVVVLADYDPQFTVSETAPMTLFENHGPAITNFGVLFMTMSAGGGDPTMRVRTCPDGFNCATPGSVRRVTLPASSGLGVPLNNTFTTWPSDLAGTVVPLTATFTIAISVPATGPFRIIWNRL